MNPVEQGFTLPAWMEFHPACWLRVWANEPSGLAVREEFPDAPVYAVEPGRLFPRDPNRAGGGDRPDRLAPIDWRAPK